MKDNPNAVALTLALQQVLKDRDVPTLDLLEFFAVSLCVTLQELPEKTAQEVWSHIRQTIDDRLLTTSQTQPAA